MMRRAMLVLAGLLAVAVPVYAETGLSTSVAQEPALLLMLGAGLTAVGNMLRRAMSRS